MLEGSKNKILRLLFQIYMVFGAARNLEFETRTKLQLEYYYIDTAATVYRSIKSNTFGRP
jgi:hypothetical protein